MGWELRCSHTTNPVIPNTPTANEAMTPVLVHPCSLARTSARTTPSRPRLASATPPRSRGWRGPRDSVRRQRASTANTTPTGTLIQKIDCHDHPLVTAPPTRGPAATATPPMAPHTPSAWFLFSDDTAADSNVSDRGMISAPPRLGRLGR